MDKFCILVGTDTKKIISRTLCYNNIWHAKTIKEFIECVKLAKFELDKNPNYIFDVIILDEVHFEKIFLKLLVQRYVKNDSFEKTFRFEE